MSEATDRLGRRTGPRRHYTLDQKRLMVEESMARGSSVPSVAQRHGVNANLLFGWRRLYAQGLLSGEAALAAPLLPVRIETPTIVASTSAAPRAKPELTQSVSPGMIEVQFASGECLRLTGSWDRIMLSGLIAALRQR